MARKVVTDDDGTRVEFTSTTVGVRFSPKELSWIDELRGYEPRASFIRRMIQSGITQAKMSELAAKGE